MATLVIAHSHVQLHYNTQAEIQRMVARPHMRQMLADVGMVKTYSKSAHVNDLGFAWTDPPFCMDRLAPLFAWTGPPPCSYGFPPGGFTLHVHTAPSLHLPLFLEETFYTPFIIACTVYSLLSSKGEIIPTK